MNKYPNFRFFCVLCFLIDLSENLSEHLVVYITRLFLFMWDLFLDIALSYLLEFNLLDSGELNELIF